jgi:hypothetical protein
MRGQQNIKHRLYFLTPGNVINKINLVILPTSSRIKQGGPRIRSHQQLQTESVNVIFELQQTTWFYAGSSSIQECGGTWSLPLLAFPIFTNPFIPSYKNLSLSKGRDTRKQDLCRYTSRPRHRQTSLPQLTSDVSDHRQFHLIPSTASPLRPPAITNCTSTDSLFRD